jgi:ECF transporter S component (folate family)
MADKTEKSSNFDIKKYFTFKFDIQNLVTLGMLLATFIVLDYLTIRVGTGMKFNLSFLAVAIAGALYGPLPTALMCVAGDILVCILGGEAPLWQLTITAALTGFVYGFILYGRTGKNLALFSIFARIADSIIISIGLNTMILMQAGFMSPTLPAFITRLTKALIEIPIYSLVLAVLLPQIVLLHHKINVPKR